MRYVLLFMVCSLGVAGAVPAVALPVWPATNSQWLPLYVTRAYLPDPDNDYSGASGSPYLDIEGDSTYAAAYYYISDQGTSDPSDDVLMFRMRIDGTKSPLSTAYQFSFNTDANLSTIDWVLQADMQSDNLIELVQATTGGPTYGVVNLSTTNTWSGAVADWGRILIPATDGSNFEGTPDYFVDVAIPWSNWQAATGIKRTDSFRVALSTSTQHNVINKDFPQAAGSTSPVDQGWSDPANYVPEPATWALMGIALGVLGLKRRKSRVA